MLDRRPFSVAIVSPAAKRSPAPQREGRPQIGIDQARGGAEGGAARQHAGGARLEPRRARRGKGAPGEIAQTGEVFGEGAAGGGLGRRPQRLLGETGRHRRLSDGVPGRRSVMWRCQL